MKNLSEQILRFKKLSGLINEDNKTGCVEGDCKNGTGKKVISVTEGQYYVGEFKNGLFNGKGILYMNNKKFADGRFLDGDFKAGKRFRYNDGDEVDYFEEGEFVELELNGYGKRQYMGYGVENSNSKNIHIEEGTFKNGVLEKGTIEYENGKIFKGTFEYVGDKVKFTSEDGKITTDDLDSYSISDKTPLNKKTTGFCVVGDCKNGDGEYLGPLGSYKGSFKNDLFNDLSGEATLDTNVSQNDFALENFDLTKNFHTHLFKYTGQFVNGEFDGKGTIEFSDGAIYEGDFNENKISGMGTFTFKDGSVYQGKVDTEDIDGSKSKYTLDYGDGSIDDVIDYNSKNTVEKLKLDSDDVSYDDDKDNDFYDYTDLKIYFSETKGNPGVLKYTDKNKYPQIKGKKVKISLEYIGDKTIKKEGKIDTGLFQFGDVRIGRYNLTADGKDLNEFKTIVDIDEDTKELTILLKNSNMKENFLVDKIKNLLIEGTGDIKVDDIKVGDYYRINDFREKYIKIIKLNDNIGSSYPFICHEYIIWEQLNTFQLFDESLLDEKNLKKLDKIDKSEFIEKAKNFLEGDNVIIQLGDKNASLDDLIKVLPEFKEISSQPNNNNNNNNNNNTEDKKTNELTNGWKCIKGDCKNGISTMVSSDEDISVTYEGEFTNGVFTKGKRIWVDNNNPLNNSSHEGTFIINNDDDDNDYNPFILKSGTETRFEKYRGKTYKTIFSTNDNTSVGTYVGGYKVYDGNNLVFYFEGSLTFYSDEDVLGISSGKGKITFPNGKTYDGELIATEGKDDAILTFKNEKTIISDVLNYNEKSNYNAKSAEKSAEKTTIKDCEPAIEDFYNFYVMVYRGQQPLPKDTADLERKRVYAEKCATTNYRNFNKKTKEYIKRLMSVAPGTSQTIKFKDYFEINPILTESKYIYSNSISNSIMRVLKEHSNNKNNVTIENSIIKNRLDFIYKTSNNYDLKFNLLKETKELIKKGYNENVVKTYYERLLK